MSITSNFILDYGLKLMFQKEITYGNDDSKILDAKKIFFSNLPVSGQNFCINRHIRSQSKGIFEKK